DEEPEPVGGAELPLALPRRAAHGERLGRLDDIGRVRVAGGLPGSEPLLVAAAHLPPRREVGGNQWPQHDPAPDEPRHGRPRTSRSAPSSSVTLRGRAVWPMHPIRHTRPAYSPSPPPFSIP